MAGVVLDAGGGNLPRSCLKGGKFLELALFPFITSLCTLWWENSWVTVNVCGWDGLLDGPPDRPPPRLPMSWRIYLVQLLEHIFLKIIIKYIKSVFFLIIPCTRLGLGLIFGDGQGEFFACKIVLHWKPSVLKEGKSLASLSRPSDTSSPNGSGSPRPFIVLSSPAGRPSLPKEVSCS